ncbi:hypothetical protein ACLKA7_001442 [Drosophila subpalustris]
MKEEKVIAISDEEELPPEAYVEDCKSSGAEQECVDTDITESRPGSRSDHSERDPRRRRPHYVRARVEAWRGDNMVPSPAELAESEEWAPASFHAGRTTFHRSPRILTEEGEPLPWGEETQYFEAFPRHIRRSRVDHPDPSEAIRDTMGADPFSGNKRGTPRLASGRPRKAGGRREEHVSIRFKPEEVIKSDSARTECYTRGHTVAAAKAVSQSRTSSAQQEPTEERKGRSPRE